MSIYYTGIFSGAIITLSIMMFVIAYFIHRNKEK